MRPALLVLFSAGLALAQQGSVEGRVVAAATANPLKKANVYLYPLSGRSMPIGAVSDESGRFSFRGLEPGRYRLSADRNGYVRQDYGQRSSVIDVAAGQTVKDIVIRLIQGGVISGRVINEDGEPIAHVSVSALRPRYVEGRRQLTSAGAMGMTNDLGEYRLFGLAPGRYFLNANHASFQMSMARQNADRPFEESYVTLFYPNSTDPARAAAVEVGPGADVRGIDFRLIPVRTVRVSGRVAGSSSRQRGTMIMLVPRDAGVLLPTASLRGSIDQQGAFEIRGVPPGSYTLFASRYEEGKTSSIRHPVEVGSATIEGLQVAFSPGGEIQGTLQVQGEARPDLTGIRVLLQPRMQGPFFGGAVGTVKQDGTFTAQNVHPYTYSVQLAGLPENYYLKSARLGDMDVLPSGVEISGAARAPLELTVSPGGAQVEGVVTDEKQRPAPGAIVVLIPAKEQRSQSRLFKSATADQNGHFLVRGVCPGDYTALAWTEVETGAWQDPEFLAPVESKGRTISLKALGQESIQLQALPNPLWK